MLGTIVQKNHTLAKQQDRCIQKRHRCTILLFPLMLVLVVVVIIQLGSLIYKHHLWCAGLPRLRTLVTPFFVATRHGF